MFQTVRHWWTGGRGKVTLRLFAFEFVVVVAGVLVAQGLANWASERALRQQAEEEEQRIRYEIGRSRQAVKVWRVAIPCFRERVDLMLRAAQTGTPQFSEADLIVPKAGAYTVEPISPDMDRPLRDLVGANLADFYSGIIGMSGNIKARRADLNDEWAKFGLLTATDGPLGDSERATLRAAAVRIRYLLTYLDKNYAALDAQGARFGIRPIGSGVELTIPDNPVASCDEIWRNHDIFHHEAS
jgi:hypothetical protein